MTTLMNKGIYIKLSGRGGGGGAGGFKSFISDLEKSSRVLYKKKLFLKLLLLA